MNPQSTDPIEPATPIPPQPDNPAADYSKPVAYDTQGRPLYLRPENGSADDSAAPVATPVEAVSPAGTQYVHVSRPIAPEEPDIPQVILDRSEESRKSYPHLNLSRGEFIINAVKRHPFGLVQIWAVAVILIAALAAVLASFFGNSVGSENELLVLSGLAIVAFLVFGGALLATYIYNSNRFYLTNESVIQEIQVNLVNKHEQTVSLANIEDASYFQSGIFSHMFNFGTIRLSTEGDETTYRFDYVANPKQHIAILNNAVEAFKNGRPVEMTELSSHQDQAS